MVNAVGMARYFSRNGTWNLGRPGSAGHLVRESCIDFCRKAEPKGRHRNL